MHLDLRSLRYFVCVAEELHFGRAALRLHITQPPLSQAIAQLEENLGHPLFIRNRRQVSLSPAGFALLPEARRLLASADELPRLVARAALGETGRLALAFVSTVDYSVLPPLLRRFRSRYPQVEIELREATSDVQLTELTEQRIDAGLLILPLPDKQQSIISSHTLLVEPLMLALPAEFALDRKQADANSLQIVASSLPLIIFPRRVAPALHDAILSCFRAANVTPSIGQQAIQMQTIVGLISAGMGMALVPQSVSNLQRPGVRYLPLKCDTPQIATALAWRKDDISPVLQAFLQVIRES